MGSLMDSFSNQVAYSRSCKVYCDYIAHAIQSALKGPDPEHLIGDVGRIQWDLTDEGAFRSTTKVIQMTDTEGRRYKITVEEA